MHIWDQEDRNVFASTAARALKGRRHDGREGVADGTNRIATYVFSTFDPQKTEEGDWHTHGLQLKTRALATREKLVTVVCKAGGHE